MRNIRLTLQYDGTDYHGWQAQPPSEGSGPTAASVVTLQGTIEGVIKRITGEEVNLIASGRTDAGVHALAQVAAFRTSSRLESAVIQRALNALLPPDIRVTGAAETAADFHPRYDALRKSYVYIVSPSRTLSPFLCRYVWGLHAELDEESMRRPLGSLLGRHDFSSFRAAGCGAKSTVRTISSLTMERTARMDFMGFSIPGDFFSIRVEADAFLRHMVRNIVGTIVDVGRGRIRPEDVEEILSRCDRNRAGVTAPARGLFMEKVEY